MDTLIWIVLNAIGCAAFIILGCGKKKKTASDKATPNTVTPTAAAAAAPAPSAVAAPDAQAPAQEPDAKSTQKTEGSKLATPGDGDKKDQLKPNKTKLNDKEKLIAKGQVRNKTDYPTMDDIKSDWTDKKANNEKIGATQEDKENEENPDEKKSRKEFKEPEQVKKADAKDPAYETLGGLDKDIFKK